MNRVVPIVLAVLVAAAVLVSWFSPGSPDRAWIHLAGLGLTVLLLIVAFVAGKGRQPTRPPD